MIQPTLFLGLPAYLRLEQIEITPQTLILSLVVEPSEAVCPLCQQVAHRIHSHYTRTLADLPCGGKALLLLVLIRRFLCENDACVRKIFAERLPGLTSVYARPEASRRWPNLTLRWEEKPPLPSVSILAYPVIA